MIDVNLPYQLVNEDLAAKGQTGYSNNDEYNRSLTLFENVLLEYYHRVYGASRYLSDSVKPFVKTENSTILNGIAPDPVDFAHLLDMEYRLVQNTDSSPTVEHVQMNPEKVGESRKKSAIRRPVYGRPGTYSYREASGGHIIMPDGLSGKVRYTYLRYPTYGARAITIGSEDNEIYNSGNSVQLEWPEFELPNFVDGLLFLKGVRIRDNEIVSWMAANKNFKKDFQ